MNVDSSIKRSVMFSGFARHIEHAESVYLLFYRIIFLYISVVNGLNPHNFVWCIADDQTKYGTMNHWEYYTIRV